MDPEKLGEQFNIEYDTMDTGARRYSHLVTARTKEGDYAGHMLWTSHSIRNIDVHPDFQRQGIATAMWQKGHELAAENARIPQPKHSARRTNEGDAWARAVGGRLPRRRD